MSAEPAPLDTMRLVASREIRTTVRRRVFQITTVISVLAVAGILIASHLLGSHGDRRTLGTVGAAAHTAAVAVRDAAANAPGDNKLTVKLQSFGDESAARGAIRKGSVDAAIVGNPGDLRVIVKHDLDPTLAGVLSSVNATSAIVDRLQAAGLSESQARAVIEAPPLNVTAIEPQSARGKQAQGLAFGVVVFLFFFLLVSLMAVATGVVEEKSTRVVEVILSTVRPRELLYGKVMGIGLLGIVQVALIGLVALGTGFGLGSFTASSAAVTTIAQAFAWFVLGFAFFAFAAAAVGSTVSRQEDLQAAIQPLSLLITAMYLAGLWSASHTDATVTKILSFVPPVSVVVMPPRWAAGTVPVWQVGLSAAIMIATAALVGRLAARIYERSVLRMGARVPWRQVLRAAR